LVRFMHYIMMWVVGQEDERWVMLLQAEAFKLWLRSNISRLRWILLKLA